MEPKNPTLENDFPIERGDFLGSMLVLSGEYVYVYLYSISMQQMELEQMFQVEWHATKMKVCFRVQMVVYVI